MNCIYCHQELIFAYEDSMSKYTSECKSCNIFYGWQYNNIVRQFETIRISFNKSTYVIIDLERQIIKVDLSYCNYIHLPLTWIFPSNINYFICKVRKLRAFL